MLSALVISNGIGAAEAYRSTTTSATTWRRSRPISTPIWTATTCCSCPTAATTSPCCASATRCVCFWNAAARCFVFAAGSRTGFPATVGSMTTATRPGRCATASARIVTGCSTGWTSPSSITTGTASAAGGPAATSNLPRARTPCCSTPGAARWSCSTRRTTPGLILATASGPLGDFGDYGGGALAIRLPNLLRPCRQPSSPA